MKFDADSARRNVAQRHYRMQDGRDYYCAADGHDWPCAEAVLVAEVDRLRSANFVSIKEA